MPLSSPLKLIVLLSPPPPKLCLLTDDYINLLDKSTPHLPPLLSNQTESSASSVIIFTRIIQKESRTFYLYVCVGGGLLWLPLTASVPPTECGCWIGRPTLLADRNLPVNLETLYGCASQSSPPLQKKQYLSKLEQFRPYPGISQHHCAFCRRSITTASFDCAFLFVPSEWIW